MTMFFRGLLISLIFIYYFYRVRNNIFKVTERKLNIMGKKKKEKEYDYSEFNYEGDMKEMMRETAESIQQFVDYMEEYTIFEGMTDEEWKENSKTLKKLIKKLKKGDPSVFNVEVFNELNDRRSY